MTDHPRFEPIRSTPDQAHLSYHGGRLVSSVMRLVDWWRARCDSRPPTTWTPFDPAYSRMGAKTPWASRP
jgi:hypothetical protein